MNTLLIDLYHQQFFLQIWNPLHCKLVPFVHLVIMPLKLTSFAKTRAQKSPDLLIFQFKKVILIPELNLKERDLIVVGNYTLVTQRKIKCRPSFVWVGTGQHFNTCAIFLHPESSRSFLSIPTQYFSPLSLPVVVTEISAWPGWQKI